MHLGSVLNAIRPFNHHLNKVIHNHYKSTALNFCRTTSASCAERGNAEKIVEILNEKLSNNRNMQQHMNRMNYPSIIKYLITLNVNDETIVQTFEKHPQLSMYPASAWHDTIDIIISNGLSLDTAISGISKCPELLQSSNDQLMNSFDKIRLLSLNESSVTSLISFVPSILLAENHSFKQIQSRIAILKKMFRKSDLDALIERSPVVLVEEWDTVEMKIHYVLFKIGLDQRHIVRSGVLNHSLMHIKLRHKFLERAGIYKFPGHKLGDRIETNPSLGVIANTSDSEFIQKAAPNLTIEELLAFKELLQDEEDNIAGEIDINYDSEDDS